MKETPESILKKYWNHSSFRSLQKEVVEAVLNNNDVLAIMPTGGGKSVCFQVPALLKEGLCLVISPLVALMKDQVDGLVQKGIKAMCIHSGLNFIEVENGLRSCVDEGYKFLYISPERLATTSFRQWLPLLNLSFVAVDEAHCISQWGYDFRPPYLKIAELKEYMPNVRFIALTASATPLVAEDILDKLNVRNAKVFRQSFNKPNLSFSVFHAEAKILKCLQILKRVEGSAIVFCNTRKKTKEVADLLRKENICADFYHAGLNYDERCAKQLAWMKGHCRVMVCTNAFGMGIDKADVRTVIHFNGTDCVENYYQEAGRAGRDGKRSFAVLLYETEDLSLIQSSVSERFPPIEKIREIYQHLCDFLTIPCGSGLGCSYPFDLPRFCNSFKLRSNTVYNVIKLLEQSGSLALTDGFYLPSTVGFSCDRATLNEIEQSAPHLDEVVKALLRTYHGIFDAEVRIYEKQLASILKVPVAEIIKYLHHLHKMGVIVYTPQSDEPKIIFLHDRVPNESFWIDTSVYFKRRDIFQKRVNDMLRYFDIKSCRSRYLGEYFGDTSMKDCGICDNCLEKKHGRLTKADFAGIETSVLEIAAKESVNLNSYLLQLKNLERKKTLEVISYLEEKEAIYIDETGCIRIKRKT